MKPMGVVESIVFASLVDWVELDLDVMPFNSNASINWNYAYTPIQVINTNFLFSLCILANTENSTHACTTRWVNRINTRHFRRSINKPKLPYPSSNLQSSNPNRLPECQLAVYNLFPRHNFPHILTTYQ